MGNIDVSADEVNGMGDARVEAPCRSRQCAAIERRIDISSHLSSSIFLRGSNLTERRLQPPTSWPCLCLFRWPDVGLAEVDRLPDARLGLAVFPVQRLPRQVHHESVAGMPPVPHEESTHDHEQEYYP